MFQNLDHTASLKLVYQSRHHFSHYPPTNTVCSTREHAPLLAVNIFVPLTRMDLHLRLSKKTWFDDSPRSPVFAIRCFSLKMH